MQDIVAPADDPPAPDGGDSGSSSSEAFGDEAPGTLALIVGSSTKTPPNDIPIVDRLTEAGWNVRLVDDDDLAPSSLDGTSIVVVSSSVVPTKIPDWLGDVALPILNTEAYVQTTLRLADFGRERPEEAVIRVVNDRHPLAGDLTGDVTVQNPVPIGVGYPVESAQVVARVPGTNTASIYGVEAGAALLTGVAPARRVGFFFSYESPASATEQAWQLLDAALQWVGADTPEEPTSTTTTTTTTDGGSTTSTSAVTSASSSAGSTLWANDFEATDWRSGWGISHESHPNHVKATTGYPGGGRALRVTAPGSDAYTGYGTMLRSLFRDMGTAGTDEAWLRYSVFLPADWQPFDGGKLPGLAGITSRSTIGRTPSGGNYHEQGWSGRVMWRRPTNGDPNYTRVSSYLYVRYAAGRSIYDNRNGSNGSLYGIQVNFRRNPDYREPWSTARPLLYLRRGQWNTIELRYKMNTPGANNGVFQGWLNGELGVDFRDVQYRTSNAPDLNVDELMFDTFYGGPTANKTAQTWAFDNIAIRGRG